MSPSSSSSRSRIPVLIGAVLLLACAAWLTKGLGIKTRILRMMFPRPQHIHAAPTSLRLIQLEADPGVQFERVALPTTDGTAYTCVRFGPDGRLYAASIDGRIFRFDVGDEGELSRPQVFDSLQKANHGPRLLTGFCFDPASTPTNLILWVSNGYFGFHDVPDFTGKVTRISGPDLSVVEDAVIHLPRSIRDHLTNQPKFGPDGALYIPQGCNSAYGAPDPGWGNRPERLLSGSILRLDVRQVVPGRPIDALTRDGGGTYDPYAPDAPLTIYASGVRNAYSLVWTDSGRLYVPTNGSSAGGNAPAGDGAPALDNIPTDEDDWLFRITPGRYYGHPNPQQGHFVLNGGNPGGPQGPATISEYPLGTRPDPDWTPAVFDFGTHISANGVVEYQGDFFGGRLDHSLIVCRFNVGSDLVCLSPDAHGEYTHATTLAGCEDLNQPLDVTEDPLSGDLYVSEYGAKRLTLFRPTVFRHRADAVATLRLGNGREASRAKNGRQLFNTTCIACHGVHGQGIPNLGANLQDSRFVAAETDAALVDFIKVGRQPNDSRSVLKLVMPPRGGNPSLSDSDLHDIVAYLRTLQDSARLARYPATQPIAATRD